MSISSTLKSISMADRMSVPQLQQAVKDGSLPAYIAVPLIQERMKDKQQAAMAAAAQQQQQPPVAQRVMQEADQQEALAALPTGMPQQYAGGGIVAFAEGDLVDDEDADEERDYMSALGQAMALRDARVNQTPSVEGGLRSLPTMTHQDVAGARLRADRTQQPTSQYDASGHKYDNLANKYSGEMGLPANLARYALHRETGGLKDPDTAVSKAGAIGPGQLMPATAKMLGVDPHKPEENVYGTVKYLKQLYDKYDGNEQLTLAAYNAGPGRVDKALKSGRGITSLPAETLGYIKMAEGGLAHFAGKEPDDRLVQDDTSPIGRWWDKINAGSEDYVARENRRAELGPKSGALGFFRGQSDADYAAANRERGDLAAPTAKLTPTLKPGQPMPGRIIGPDSPQPAPTQEQMGKGTPGSNRALQIQTENQIAAKTPSAYYPPLAPAAPSADDGNGKSDQKPPAPQQPSDAYNFWEDYKAQKSEIGKQKELDKWLGMMNAGLAIMGGKSQNPLENIGQGGMYGAQTYAQAAKATGAEEAALMKAGILAKRYEGLEDIARGGQEMTAQRAEAALTEKKREAAQAAIDRMLKTHTAKVQAKYGKDIMLMDPATKKQYETEMDSIYTTPRYLELDQIASPASYGNFKYLGAK